jgi:hypothetical protein
VKAISPVSMFIHSLSVPNVCDNPFFYLKGRAGEKEEKFGIFTNDTD